ncbi:MAG: ExeM/NucH family extracellular endonuclease [Ornithinimicrobium sp.]
MKRSPARRISGACGVFALVAAGLVVPVQTSSAAVSSDLIISEYVEGSGNNKAVELFNGTESSIDLNSYTLEVYFNGATTASVRSTLSGTVAPGATFVYGTSALSAYTQQTFGGGLWNGDDAIVLRGAAGVVDSFGQVGVDPGNAWTGGGVSAQNQTLRRAGSVCAGDIDPSDAFDPSLEWVQFPEDTFGGLGAHTNDCSTTPSPSSARINEFSASTTGPDVEYLEVYADGDTDYSGLDLLAVAGDVGSPELGSVTYSTEVGSTDADGFWLQDLAADTLDNGTLSLLLVAGWTGETLLDSDADGQIDPAVDVEIVDAVTVSDGDVGDLTYGGTTLEPGFDGVSFSVGGASRIPDGTDTDTAADWVRNDFDLAGIPGNTGSLVSGEALNTPGASNSTTVVNPPGGVCGDRATFIGAVQGDGAQSPIAGEQVGVEGIVVGDFQDGGFDGFFVQDSDGGDADAATSDGIFVYAPDGDAVDSGDRVRVDGTVGEFAGQTQLSNVSVEVCAPGVALPEATSLTLPIGETQYEAVEGMYVTLPDSLAILEYFNYGRFGEIALGTDRQYQPTAVFEPGSAEAADVLARNAAERITLDDGRSIQNPDPARHPNGADFTLDNTFRGGDLVTGATGVMDYRFNAWRLQPTQAADFTVVNPRPDVPEVGGSTTIASFNVLNYFTTLGARGADDAEEFDRQEAKIVAALAELDADIFGLIEIENNGTAVDTLVAALNAEVGGDTYAALDTGVIGTDEITTALIYKPGEVTPEGDFATLTAAVDPRFLDSKNRPALAQTFNDNDSGGGITVVVNHLKSKGSGCGDVGDPTDPDGQGNCNGVRADAAAALADWTAADPTGTGEADTLVIGDLNSYDKEDPIAALTGAGFTDLLLDRQGELAYSYVFDGQLGYLDYALTNDAATAQVTGAAVWHINSDEASVLDYDTSFKQDAQDAIYAPDPYRSSDHDPVLVGVDLVAEAAAVRVDRIAGADRYDTAARVARTFDSPSVVYVASGEVFPDALAATPAAIGDEAPLVLTKRSGLPDSTADVLTELQPTSVVVLGGKNRIPTSILTQIEVASGAEVTRVSGTNRYDTAAQLSMRWAPGEADTVYLASGTMFADALSVGPLAGIEDRPVLLTRDATLPDETAAALTRLNPERIVILGGPQRVDEAVVTQASAYADTVERLFGADRYETAALVAAQVPAGDSAYVASGESFPDALSGGVPAGLAGAPVLLSESAALNGFAAEAIEDRDPDVVTVIGGVLALSDTVRQDLLELLGP